MLKPAHLPWSRRWTLPEVTSQDESCMTHLYASIANIGLTVFAGGHFKPMGCMKCTMFSAPKVHAHAHAAILHTFLTFTKSTHEQAFTRYGSWLITTRPDRENSFTARIEAPQARGLFSQPIRAKEERNGPPGSNQRLFKAKLSISMSILMAG